MPITYQFLERSIYFSMLRDPLSFEELLDTRPLGQLLDAHHDSTFVNVFDLGELTKMPVGLQVMLNTIRREDLPQKCVGDVALPPPLLLGSVVRLLNQLSSEKVEIVHTLDEAIAIVRRMLAAYIANIIHQ